MTSARSVSEGKLLKFVPKAIVNTKWIVLMETKTRNTPFVRVKPRAFN